MSQNKINSWEAGNIAKVIAAKAFEHLLKSYEDNIASFATQCYLDHVRDLGLADKREQFIAAKLIAEVEHANIVFSDGDNSWNELISGELLAPDRYYNTWTITDPAKVSAYRELNEARAPLVRKREALITELTAQMENKSANSVIKAWPEAAPFVADYFQIKKVPLSTPLETLLAKFLPMLPAPQGATS